MIKLLTFVSTLFFSLSMVWYNYAPIDQRQRVPTPLRVMIVNADSALASGMALVTERIGPRVSEAADELAGRESTRLAVIAEQGGIVTVYEDLTGADLTAGRFDKHLFLRATLDNANFSKAYLKGTLLDGASAQKTVFGDAILAESSARVANFTAAVFHQTDLSAASMQGSVFDQAIFSGSNLGRSQFTGASFIQTVFRDGKAIDARFINAKLNEARFDHVDMRRAVLDGAVLRGATMTNTALHGASLKGADLSGANLALADGLTQYQLDTACGDAQTLLPTGLTVVDCGSLQLQQPHLSGPIGTSPPRVAAITP
ncbi:pentapeptide repeat-containing protein [Parvularcula sp. LCG005]|uniref:pentapeptide repeat-containing protein n=1 Tax=Parvularcula sp. LCG005 TaxID=3078805 RepID=UPI002942FDDC|nr:pentapeptide repeat-containing protein [Parvularcula sp. LCG005]WOI54263.1 pentapeptide repeat-containing protein [Parvularcula sp. LCG005]